MFLLCSLHSICRSLSKASWLKEEYRNHVKDKVDKLFVLLGNSPERDPGGFQKALADYGGPLAEKVDFWKQMCAQYTNAAARCYCIAYRERRPQWESILNSVDNGNDTLFTQIAAVLRSEEYREQILATEVSTNLHSIRFKQQLSILNDKLALLAVAKGGPTMVVVNKLTDDVMAAAHMTGLVREDMENPDGQVSSWPLA